MVAAQAKSVPNLQVLSVPEASVKNRLLQLSGTQALPSGTTDGSAVPKVAAPKLDANPASVAKPRPQVDISAIYAGHEACLRPTFAMEVVFPNGNFAQVYGLFDSGSNRSFITKDFQRNFKLQTHREFVTLNGLGTRLSGHHEVATISLRSMVNPQHVIDSVKAIVVETLPINVYQVVRQCHADRYNFMDGVKILEIPATDVPLLLGTDLAYAFRQLDSRQRDSSSPVALLTNYGWSIMGPPTAPAPEISSVASACVSALAQQNVAPPEECSGDIPNCEECPWDIPNCKECPGDILNRKECPGDIPNCEECPGDIPTCEEDSPKDVKDAFPACSPEKAGGGCGYGALLRFLWMALIVFVMVSNFQVDSSLPSPAKLDSYGQVYHPSSHPPTGTVGVIGSIKSPVQQEMAPTPYSCIEAQEVRPNGIIPSNGLVNGFIALPSACAPHISAWERSSIVNGFISLSSACAPYIGAWEHGSIVNDTVQGTFVELGTGKCESAGISGQQSFEVIQNNDFQMNIVPNSAFQPSSIGTICFQSVV